MEQNYKKLFIDYYNATLGGFFSDNEKARILKLIATANGINNNCIEALIEAITRVEEENISSSLDCQNFMSYACFMPSISDETRCAVTALNGIFSAQQEITVYSNELVWRRNVLNSKNSIAIAYYKYAQGKLQDAIDLFEKSSRSNGDLPMTEYLAIISLEAEDYQRAYKYAIQAQNIGEGEKIEAPYLVEIETSSASMLSAEMAEKIKKEASGKASTPVKIGF